MTTILLTGANGFVGQHLGTYLLKQGYDVVAAVRQSNSRINFTPTSVVPVGDIDATTEWSTALERVDVIIHLAARVHVMQEQAADPSADPLATFRQVNTMGTIRLAQQAVEIGVKRLVYLSSIKVNGESTTTHPFTEQNEMAPEDPYARSKWEAEQNLLDLATQTGLEVSIIRPPLVYGPGVGGNFLRLLGLVARGWPLPLASIYNRRSLVGIRNLCNFIEVCTHHPRAAGEVFLVSDDQDISTPELMRLLATMMRRPYRLLPFPPSILAAASKLLGQQGIWERLAGSLQVDITKARQQLGWEPPFSLEQGLADTVDWYQKIHLASE
ncbi:MAG: SDR family oxidoreductase [Halobacteria archaeon]|nr:SDR family oxidoreductase [Halobacteria archaeon]